jgi:2-polyprenyl-3-methyl-5-hydroxy-6-metoxy-1,4-benzoquinol methylase
MGMYSRARDFETSYKIANQIVIPVLKQWNESLVQRVLDIGCGVGGYALAFAEAGASCTAIDLDSEAVKYAREKAGRHAGRHVEFIAGDMFAVKLEQEFDLIFCHDVIEHVDPAQLLALIANLLRPGGKAFFTFPPFRGPNGGHQIGPGYKNFALWWIPYIHLWPTQIIHPVMTDHFREYFDELSRISLHQFRKLCEQTGLYIQHERLYLIRPEFQVTLGIPPLQFPWDIDFLVTGAHFLVSREK